jgi:hypothetical protein
MNDYLYGILMVLATISALGVSFLLTSGLFALVKFIGRIRFSWWD